MKIEVFETKERVLADNESAARETRALMRERGTLLINLMGSPGAGKTSVLSRVIPALGEFKIGVMEADVDSDVDAKTVAALGARVIQLHTGGLCHMDADMTRRGLDRMGIDGLDAVFLENIGNLVCPAEFEIGADLRMTVLSVPEGDDKPLKYPLMFTIADLVAVNKLDTAPIFDFDLAAFKARVLALNPKAEIIPISAKTGEGCAERASFLRSLIEKRRRGE